MAYRGYDHASVLLQTTTVVPEYFNSWASTSTSIQFFEDAGCVPMDQPFDAPNIGGVVIGYLGIDPSYIEAVIFRIDADAVFSWPSLVAWSPCKTKVHELRQQRLVVTTASIETTPCSMPNATDQCIANS